VWWNSQNIPGCCVSHVVKDVLCTGTDVCWNILGTFHVEVEVEVVLQVQVEVESLFSLSDVSVYRKSCVF
jgi:hypothetical protein